MYIYPPPCPEARVGVFRGPASAASLVPWTLGLRVIKGPQGGFVAWPRHSLQPPASLKIDHFFDCFLTSLLTPSWTDFGANLAPTWPPKSVQEGSKSLQKCIQICILVLIPFSIDFWWILAPTWSSKPLQNPSQNRPKIAEDSALGGDQGGFWRPSWTDFGGQVGAKLAPKSVQEGVQNDV